MTNRKKRPDVTYSENQKPYADRASSRVGPMLPSILITNKAQLNDIYDELLHDQNQSKSKALPLPLLITAFLMSQGFEVDSSKRIINYPKSASA